MLLLDNVLIGERLVWLVVLGIFKKNLVHVGTGILVQLITTAKYNKGDFAVAQNGQFVRLLHYTKFSLVEGYLSIPFVCDSGYLYFFTTHGSNFEKRT